MELLKINIPAIILFGMAWYMVAHDVDNWGWVLVAGICITHTISNKKD